MSPRDEDAVFDDAKRRAAEGYDDLATWNGDDPMGSGWGLGAILLLTALLCGGVIGFVLRGWV